ncbi:MAG: M23 family metallopeptidase [Gemmatimonadaceae bacterium]
MPWIISISGPLARTCAVLTMCLFLCLFAGCVERRADGTRGSDTGSATGAEIKRDTGILISPMPPTPAGSVSSSPQVPRTARLQSTGSATTATQSDVSDVMELAQRHPIVPISGIAAAKLPDTFNEIRGGTRKHEALDILAPRGTPVHSADDGTVIKLFASKAGGLTVYVTGPAQHFVYYYAHLDGYANGLTEGQMLRKGDVLGYVGASGNADPNVPHLHFAIARTDNIKEWWKGEPINPTAVLQAAARN